MHPNPTQPLKLIGQVVATHKANSRADNLYVRPVYGTGPVDDGVHVRYAIVDGSETYVTFDTLAEADALLAEARKYCEHRNGPICRAVMRDVNELKGEDNGEYWAHFLLNTNYRLYRPHRRNDHRTSDQRELINAWAFLRLCRSFCAATITDTEILIKSEATES